MCFLDLAEIHWWEVVVDFVTIVLVRDMSDMYFGFASNTIKSGCFRLENCWSHYGVQWK